MLFGMPMNALGGMTQPNANLYGLLGVDKNNARNLGLLAAAGQLLEAGAGGMRPQDASLGRGLGRAALAGMGTYNQTLKSDMANQLAGLQASKLITDAQTAAATKKMLADFRAANPAYKNYPDTILQKVMENRATKERFTTVNDPYGRGGVAQQSDLTGKLVNYQAPRKTFTTVDPNNIQDMTGINPSFTKPMLERLVAQYPDKAIQLGSDGSINVRSGGGLGDFRLEATPGGGVKLVSGKGLEGTNRKEFQKKVIDMTDNIDQLRNMQAAFKPKYLEYGTRARLQALQVKERLGQDLTPEETADLRSLANLRRRVNSFFSKFLKETSGVAVNPTEEARAKSYLPNVGNGLTDGDSPTIFQAKVNDALAFSLATKWRYENILKKDKYRRAVSDPDAFTRLTERIPLSKTLTAEGTSQEVYLHEFADLVLSQRPNASPEDILREWSKQ